MLTAELAQSGTNFDHTSKFSRFCYDNFVAVYRNLSVVSCRTSTQNSSNVQETGHSAQ